MPRPGSSAATSAFQFGRCKATQAGEGLTMCWVGRLNPLPRCSCSTFAVRCRLRSGCRRPTGAVMRQLYANPGQAEMLPKSVDSALKLEVELDARRQYCCGIPSGDVFCIRNAVGTALPEANQRKLPSTTERGDRFRDLVVRSQEVMVHSSAWNRRKHYGNPPACAPASARWPKRARRSRPSRSNASNATSPANWARRSRPTRSAAPSASRTTGSTSSSRRWVGWPATCSSAGCTVPSSVWPTPHTSVYG